MQRGKVCISFLDSYNDEVQPKKKLEDVIHLAELCIEVLQQNEEHHAEVVIPLSWELNTFSRKITFDLIFLCVLFQCVCSSRKEFEADFFPLRVEFIVLQKTV